MNIISNERIQYLVDNFYQNWDYDYNVLDSISTSEELHFIAEIFNWDYNIELLMKIINNPLCDKGTALMIYWLSCPGYYTQFDNEEDVDINPEIFVLIKNIEENYKTGFYKNENILFNPNSDQKFGNIAKSNGEQDGDKWEIEKIMFKPTNGEAFPEYKWKTANSDFVGTLVNQEEANGKISIILDNSPLIKSSNKNEIEKEMKFPIELLGKDYDYTDSWNVLFRIKINNKGELEDIKFLFADNQLVLNNAKDITKLKFELKDTSFKEPIDLGLEVSFSKQNKLRIVK
jgi:hypothetical protein